MGGGSSGDPVTMPAGSHSEGGLPLGSFNANTELILYRMTHTDLSADYITPRGKYTSQFLEQHLKVLSL